MTVLLAKYVLAVALLPVLISVLAFAVGCTGRCEAFPWLIFFVIPCLSLLALLPLASWTYRSAASLAPQTRRVVRVVVVGSILWGPCVAGLGFVLVYSFARTWGS